MTPIDVNLFVYGTLKRGYSNHRLLVDATFLGNDEAPGRLYAFGRGVPHVKPLDGSQLMWVKGEVYRLTNPEMLRAVDRLEGHPNGYTRTEVRLRSGMMAHIYYWHHTVWAEDLVQNGEWPAPEHLLGSMTEVRR